VPLGVHNVVSFLLGSVAVGMATENSDIDTYLVINGSRTPAIPAHIQLNKYSHSIDEDSYAGVRGIDDLLADDYIKPFTDNVMEKGNAGAFWVLTDTFPLVFFPSLNEFTDPQEKALVTSWRKQALENIIRLYPNQAEDVWNLIRQYLRSRLVDYDKLETQHIDVDKNGQAIRTNDNKRKGRVEDAIQAKLQDRFPADEEKQVRAKSFIKSKRQQFEYPDFKTITSALDVKIPPALSPHKP